MTPRIFFRSLVGLEFIIGTVYGYGFSTIQRYPESWRDIDLLSVGSWALFALGPLLAILYLVACVGLFFFWSPARTLTVLYLAGGVLLVALNEYPQTPGWVESLNRLSLAAIGLIIGIMYLPPFKQLFEPRTRSNNTVDTDARESSARRSP